MSSRHKSDRQKSSDKLAVVGIGASAESWKALGKFFENLSDDSGAAFVVIQHLSPKFKSLMQELLQPHTRMQVRQVQKETELQPNSVYLIPPDKNLVLEGNVLKLQQRKHKNDQYGFNCSIDIFFDSLANNYGERAIGVILSGTGSDGTFGLRAIKEANGIALVQEPETAESDSMPRSALATGMVDRVLPVEELARATERYILNILDPKSILLKEGELLDASSLQEIADILFDSERVNFSHYKPTTISRRIYRRCLINNVDAIDKYIELLKSNAEERKTLTADLSIEVTSFFRDPEAWKVLENILPLLIEQAAPNEELRFWVSACSTGEEAYSLGILIHEALTDTEKPLRVKIFATDINKAALETASLGIYPQSIVNNITDRRLQKYFVPQDDCYQVTRTLREMMVFSTHDLTKDAPFKQINLVSCRNVLIYMESDLQTKIIQNLHFSLVDRGFLFLGEAETLGNLESRFQSIDRKWKIHQKYRQLELPLTYKNQPRLESLLPRARQVSPKNDRDSVKELAFQQILHRHDLVVLVVSSDNQLLYVNGDSQRYFKPPSGDITSNVIKMVVQPLQLPLNTALHRARKEKKPISYGGIKLTDRARQVRQINLQILPSFDDSQSNDCLVVQIEPEKLQPSQSESLEKFESNNAAFQRIVELETELQHTRENLQALVEELESTNEEQQASNEELTASNEELQSTNEKLHLANEELHTVNVEYQYKIQELTELSNDIDNLLKSTEIGVIFLDVQLRIRKFTPAVSAVISLRHTDLERPLADFYWKIECPNLLDLLQQVLTTGRSLELEVKLRQEDTYFLMRINPYQTEDRQNEGLVVTFVRIDEIKQVQRKLEDTLNTLQQRESELSQLNQELESRVKARTDELARANVSLQTEVTIRQLTEATLKIRLQQQAAIALLGKQALAEIELDRLFKRATVLLARNLNVEYTNIFELLPEDNKLLLKAGVGWSEGLVEEATVPTDSGSQAGYTLRTKESVIVKDLSTETRFRGCNLLVEHSIVSGISTIIASRDRSYGVLGAHTRQKNSFSQDDINFLQAVANILTMAISAREDKQTLQGSERYFRAIFEQAAVGIAEVSPDGDFIRVNQRLANIVGYAKEQLITLTFQEITHPDDLNTDLEYVRQILAGEIESYSMEKRYYKSDNSIVWINLTVSLVKDSLGQPDYFISVIEDISDRKQAEAILKQQKIELQQANQAKDTFIAQMNHELRTPLNSILGFSDLLARDSYDTAKQQDFLNIINRSGKHLLSLIDNILNFSKISINRLELESKIGSLTTLLTEITTVFQFAARKNNLVFNPSISSNLPQAVYLDFAKLRQVLYNLLGNAIKFTTTGSVTFTVGYVKEITKEKKSPSKIRFQVEDTGIGIPQAELTRVFAPFEQLHNLNEREGTGLGLAISQKLVQLLGSEIELESQLGVGSKFWFDLEIVEVDANLLPDISQPQRQFTQLASARKVLVVDDNEANRSLLVNYLKPLGFIVAEADNGESGLAVVESFQPDAILIDLIMPVMDAREMIARIRQQPKLKQTVIIAISASCNLIFQPPELDCDDCLTKPIKREKVLEILSTHLQLDWLPAEAEPETEDLSAFVAPPTENLSQLLRSVKLGDLDTVEEQTKLIEAMGTQYTSFSQTVRQLALSCQQQQLEIFIQSFMS